MHEMAIASSLIEIIKEELNKHGATRLVMARVCHGKLTNIVPEALQFAFEVQTQETPLAAATLEMKEIPVTVACGGCGKEFVPENPDLFYMPCPHCGREFAHEVLTGKELYLDHLEAE
ncbi:hydrogenase maturation nickel metallochaperone HypA [Desulfovibrio subterraneus]|jgi:hydrogenase nickel incorporation protein HypA/HybF|uniref:Hydrogenase maturation factor HypA n=1 Tax=Desulfovibrio subterraneus TaxID=2718620 RepID=A0A7J0BHN7_9BACT|nr:hydrogenase maturation nickel metallochaperone HypA [Desulfovibrio subterraneus]WBF67322.1 hydrogenase maturation nickel metallochaperone HypA [Desulfovibrio subterraneus]GFM33078.1 putative hydrogenase nickel incorporation protein HypA 1 [Desulfovibrio subterraneus]